MSIDEATGRTAESHVPLPPAMFQILLALVDGERHGYAIMKEVAERADGSVRLGPGTLYGTPKRLLDAGRVAESGERPAPGLGGERRRYYRITPCGPSVMRADARRMPLMVQAARDKRVLGLEPA